MGDQLELNSPWYRITRAGQNDLVKLCQEQVSKELSDNKSSIQAQIQQMKDDIRRLQEKEHQGEQNILENACGVLRKGGLDEQSISKHRNSLFKVPPSLQWPPNPATAPTQEGRITVQKRPVPSNPRDSGLLPYLKRRVTRRVQAVCDEEEAVSPPAKRPKPTDTPSQPVKATRQTRRKEDAQIKQTIDYSKVDDNEYIAKLRKEEGDVYVVFRCPRNRCKNFRFHQDPLVGAVLKSHFGLEDHKKQRKNHGHPDGKFVLVETVEDYGWRVVGASPKEMIVHNTPLGVKNVLDAEEKELKKSTMRSRIDPSNGRYGEV